MGKRRAVFRLNPEVILGLFTARDHAIHVDPPKNPIPQDARVVGARYDAMADEWEIAIESDSLPETEQGALCPVLYPSVSFRFETGEQHDAAFSPFAPQQRRWS